MLRVMSAPKLKIPYQFLLPMVALSAVTARRAARIEPTMQKVMNNARTTEQRAVNNSIVISNI
jgi:hypothetical protein